MRSSRRPPATHVEQPQVFYAWSAEALEHSDEPLHISADVRLHRLIAGRFVPAQSAPQMDLFFDNPVVVLINGIVQSLCARNLGETQRLLDQLYVQAPNHADLAAFDRLLAALGHLNRAVDDPRQELEFLLDITPLARRLLGWEARDLTEPLWRQLADALGNLGFSANEPNLHRSFALTQAQDWAAAAEAVRGEAQWWAHVALCLRLAQCGFHQQRRSESLQAWFQLCWRAPAEAAAALENRQQPDTGMRALWQEFVDCKEELADSSGAAEPVLSAADFPAWLLLRDPGLNLQLGIDLPTGSTQAEQNYRCVHRWIDARRAKLGGEEMALRRTLQANHPALFSYLKNSV